MGEINGKRGDFKKAFKNSESILQETYRTPIENHNPIEPSATLAQWRDGDLLVCDATQGVSTTADLLQQASKAKNIQVISKFIGGGFGCKGSVWNHQLIAVMAAQKTGRPIKLALTRQQMFTGVGHRAATIQEVSLGAKRDGTLNALEHVATNNSATDKEYSERSAVSTRMLYQCDNLNAEHRLVKLNFQSPTFMRAPGEASGSAAVECALDELAAQLNMDPIELRLRNYAEKDQQAKKPYSSKSLKQCYQQGAAKFGWDKRKMQPRSQKDGEDWVGYGMATATYPANRFGAHVTVELSPENKVKVRCATQDIGTGSWTIFTQLTADAFGIPAKNVDLDIGDSHYPKGSVSGGSSTASSVGSALQKACDKIRDDLFELAKADANSPFYKTEQKDPVLKDGTLQLASSPSKSQTFAAIMKAAKKDVLKGEGETKAERGETKEYSTHAFGAQFAEVRVNALTGQVRVTKLTGAFASGRILNEKTARSQYMGGMVFGLGQALMEETVADMKTGRLVIKDLSDYHIPVNADVPDMDIVMVEEVDEHVNILGTKGIGEIGIVGLAAAIGNAVYNATGARVRDFPLTPDKVIAAMANLKAPAV